MTPPPRAAWSPPPPRENEEAWGRWKEQRDDEPCAEYMKRIWSVYGKEGSASAGPKEGGLETSEVASSSKAPSKAANAAPKAKAANYYQVAGGDWYWWDGEWGDKWEPKKKRKKKKYMAEEWEEWMEQNPEEDTGSSTPGHRRPTEPDQPPPRLKIRPGLDLIRRSENTAEWMQHVLENDMRGWSSSLRERRPPGSRNLRRYLVLKAKNKRWICGSSRRKGNTRG